VCFYTTVDVSAEVTRTRDLIFDGFWFLVPSVVCSQKRKVGESFSGFLEACSVFYFPLFLKFFFF